MDHSIGVLFSESSGDDEGDPGSEMALFSIVYWMLMSLEKRMMVFTVELSFMRKVVKLRRSR